MFNKYDNKGFADAIRRQKRVGLKQTVLNEDSGSFVSSEKRFLMDYVFSKLGISGQQYVQSLEFSHSSQYDFLQRRQRNIDFRRGRQFNDLTWDNQLKRYVTQLEYMRRRNIPPLTYNVISKFARSLEGQFREVNVGNLVTADSKDDEAVEMASILTMCLNDVKRRNGWKNKDAMNFLEMLSSGQPVFKTFWSKNKNQTKPQIKFRIVGRVDYGMNPGVTDYDLDNLHTEYEIHNTDLSQIIMNFADGDYDRGQEIKEGYLKYNGNLALQGSYASQLFSGDEKRNQTFYHQGVGLSSYRYYEVWTNVSDYEAITYDPTKINAEWEVHKYRDPKTVKKEIDAENASRREMASGMDIAEEDYLILFKTDYTTRKYAMYLTPWGYVLDVRESPFEGDSPFSINPPDINGESWGIIEELLNAQQSLDRQIANADALVANAAKGFWLIPDTAIPDEYDPKEYLEMIKEVNGGAVYKVRDGVEDFKPEQLFSQATNVSGNIQQLIQLYSSMVDEISGNYGAAQGKSSSGTASGYALETQNAGLNVKGIIENYLGVCARRDEKILSLILQGYDSSDYLRITGKDIKPADVRRFSYHIEESKGTNSPAHRLVLEQELLQLVRDQLMPFEVYLDISTNPVLMQAKQKMEEFNQKQIENGMLTVPEMENAKREASAGMNNTPQMPQQGSQSQRIIEQNLPKQPRV